MTPLLLSFLLLFTIVVSFVLGISLGYWAVCGILYLFKAGRPRRAPTPRSTFAHSTGAD